jgi:hypothetical protein
MGFVCGSYLESNMNNQNAPESIHSASARAARQPVVLPMPEPKALAAWLAELPLANPLYCFDAVAGALEYFNETPGLAPATRLELADHLRPMAAMLTEQAETHFLDAPLPYHPKAEFYAALAFRLNHGLGRAYALAAFDIKPSFGWFGQGDRPLALALYRAFQQLGLALLRTAQQYQNPPPDYWSTFYQLYSIAESRKLLQNRLACPEEPEACRTLLGIFKRCLLFKLASTRQMRQREMAKVYDMLGTLANHATWGAKSAADQSAAEFAIYLGESRPPSRLRDLENFSSAGVRYLGTSELAEILSKAALEAKGSNLHEKGSIDDAVLASIARNLEGLQKRRAERQLRNSPCRCVVGLNNLIAVLAQSSHQEHHPVPPMAATLAGDGQEPSLNERRLTFARDVANDDRDLRTELVVPQLLKKNLTREDIWVAQEETAHEPGPDTAVESQIANVGSHDYCIIWPADHVAGLKVGDLVGVQDPQERSLLIGVMRWLHCGEGRVRFGVDLLSLGAEVIDLLDNHMEPSGKGLLLPAEQGIRAAPELLALPGKTHPGGMARAGENTDAQYFRVQHAIRQAPSFSRFAMAPVQPDAL